MCILSESEINEVRALLDTFWPPLSQEEAKLLIKEEDIPTNESDDKCLAGLMAAGSSSPRAIGMLEDALSAVLEHEAQKVRLVLKLFSTGIGTWILSGYWGPLSQMSVEKREKALLNMARSRFLVSRRSAFHGLKRLLLACIATPHPNPIALAAGYAPKDWGDTIPAEDLKMNKKSTQDVDFIIVGSGCGGAVTAYKLASAGYTVLILEKGSAPKYADFYGDEKTAFASMYERAGLVASNDGSIAILAGATLGGGSTINWGCSLRTPPNVQEEWGFDWCKPGSSKLDKALDAIEKRLSVNTSTIKHNVANAALLRGSEQLLLDVKPAPQNFKNAGTEACSLCAYGDRFANKQAMPITYLQDALATGNCWIQPNTEVVSIIRNPDSGKAQGVRCVDGLTLFSNKGIVLSAGSLHTPCILLRSAVPNPNIGYNLKLHPVTACCALVPPTEKENCVGRQDDIPLLNNENSKFCTLLRGAPMTAACRAGPHPYDALIEVPHTGLGLAFAAITWKNAIDTKRLALRSKRLATFIILQRDSGIGGRVMLDPKTSQPMIKYTLNQIDSNRMKKALATAGKIWEKAGAQKIWTCHIANPIEWCRGQSIQTFENAVLARELTTNNATFFSAHQMGTCRMGTNPRTSVVDDRGQSWEMPSLYIADTSLFPTASGVNPMLTCLALASIVADNIIQDLNSLSHKENQQYRHRRWQRLTFQRQATTLLKTGIAGILILSACSYASRSRRR